MVFEEWGKWIQGQGGLSHTPKADIQAILADWKAEREERHRKEKELSELTAKTVKETFEKMESLREQRDKLIGLLENCLGFIDELKDHGISNWSGEMQVRADLAEVEEKV